MTSISRVNSDDVATRRSKAASRKIVINFRDEEDEHCPSWLKGFEIGASHSATASILTSTTSSTRSFPASSSSSTYLFSPPAISGAISRQHSMHPASGVKRVYEPTSLTSNSSLVRQSTHSYKKMDSPIRTEFFSTEPPARVGRASVLFRYQTALIDMIDYEIKSYTCIKEGLLMMKDADCCSAEYLQRLNQISKELIDALLKSLVRYSGLRDTEKLTFADADDLQHLNVFQLVYNCQIRIVNIGGILREHLLDVKRSRFMVLMISYYAQILNNSVDVDNSVALWKPIEKLFKYPELFKNLINSMPGIGISESNKSELTGCLIGVNKLIGHCKSNLQSAASIAELERQLGEEGRVKEKIFSDYSATPNSANDIKLLGGKAVDTPKAPKETRISRGVGSLRNWPKGLAKCLVHEEKEDVETTEVQRTISPVSDHKLEALNYERLIKCFTHKYQGLLLIKKSIVGYRVEISRFLEMQVEYSVFWSDLLDEPIERANEHYIISMYTSFKEKLQGQYNSNRREILAQLKSLMEPIDSVLGACAEIQQHVKTHKKHASTHELQPDASGSIIREVIPQMIKHMNEFGVLMMTRVNQCTRRWLKDIIGMRSLQEYHVLKAGSEHRDIDEFYVNASRIAKSMIVRYD